MNTALMTDAYELTMLDAWVRDGKQDEPAVFEVFARSLPPGFRYGVVAGTGRALDAIENFRFRPHSLVWLSETLGLSDDTLDFLASYRFDGTVRGYAEGDLYFPNSPVLQVEGRLADVVLETVILSIMNHDCAIASKAARIVAEGRPAVLIEMGSRRTHEEAAIAAARAAYIAGFDATSNLEAGLRHGIPVRGTAAHAFTLSYKAGQYSDDAAEHGAFSAQIAAMGPGTTLLVDTFDVSRGILNAVSAWNAARDAAPDYPQLGAIRLDSGDLALEARKARTLLDEAGLTSTKIIVSSDLDEHVIKDLRTAGAPIDGYGVGTKLVSTPPAGMVYKLVEVNGTPVAKASRDKVSIGGRKVAFRTMDENGHVTSETLHVSGDTPVEVTTESGRPLHVSLLENGKRTSEEGVEEARRRHAERIGELPPNERAVWHSSSGPFITARLETL